MRIYLLGFMGCGKSYFGQKLAKALGYSFIDLDDLIESKERKTILEIFETQGEAHFRQLEKKYLLHTLSQNKCIIATGGGTPCFHDNMNFINEYGWSIYLEASSSLLAKRLEKERSKRPIIAMLTISKLEPFIEDLLQIRKPFYEKAQLKIVQDIPQNFDAQKTINILKKIILK